MNLITFFSILLFWIFFVAGRTAEEANLVNFFFFFSFWYFLWQREEQKRIWSTFTNLVRPAVTLTHQDESEEEQMIGPQIPQKVNIQHRRFSRSEMHLLVTDPFLPHRCNWVRRISGIPARSFLKERLDIAQPCFSETWLMVALIGRGHGCLHCWGQKNPQKRRNWLD